MRIALLALFVSGCGPAVVQLHPVTGDLFALSPPGPPPEPLGPFEGTDDERFDALLSRWSEDLDEHHATGGAVAVVVDGRLAHAGGVGVREAGGREPVTPTTRFRIASVTKMLVAATVLSLVEDGLLALDRPLVELVPGFARGGGDDASLPTIAMLLSHTSGIADSVYCPDRASLAETLAMHVGDRYWAPPGRLFDYSNMNYALLAMAIESVTGRRFEDAVAERVFLPAGMTTATFDASASDPSLARGHVNGHVVWTEPVDCEASRAAGGVVASAEDLAHWAETFLAGGGAMLSPASIEAMTTGGAVAQREPLVRYGFGVMEGRHAGLRTLAHGGFAAGFTSIVHLVPERRFAVVVLATGTSPVEDVALAAESTFLGTPESVEARVPAPPARFGEYVGLYEDPTGALGAFEVFVDGDALRARFLGEHTAPIVTQLRVSFERDAAGTVEYAVTRAGVARRLDAGAAGRYDRGP